MIFGHPCVTDSKDNLLILRAALQWSQLSQIVGLIAVAIQIVIHKEDYEGKAATHGVRCWGGSA